MNFSNSSLYSFAVSFSYIIIASLSPLLSGIADYSGRRKFFLKTFTLIGSLACTVLYFFKGEPQLWLGTSAFILATIGFAGSLVFYDSHLPLIVTRLLLAGNPQDSREAMLLWLSADEGKTWQPSRTVQSAADGGAEFSYPALLLGRDGRIHLAYTWRRQGIKHATFSEAWLDGETP